MSCCGLRVLLYRYTGETESRWVRPSPTAPARDRGWSASRQHPGAAQRPLSARRLRSRSCAVRETRSPPTRTRGPFDSWSRTAARAGGHRSPFFQVLLASRTRPSLQASARAYPDPVPVPGVGAIVRAQPLRGGAEEGASSAESSMAASFRSLDDRSLWGTHPSPDRLRRTPERAVGELPLLGGEERHQLLAEWNDNPRELPRRLSVPVGFAEVPARRPRRLPCCRQPGSGSPTPSSTARRRAGPAPVRRGLPPRPRSGLPRALARDGCGVSRDPEGGGAYVPGSILPGGPPGVHAARTPAPPSSHSGRLPVGSPGSRRR